MNAGSEARKGALPLCRVGTWIAAIRCRETAKAFGADASTKQAKLSAMRRKPLRQGDRLMEFLVCTVVIVFVSFVVEFEELH